MADNGNMESSDAKSIDSVVLIAWREAMGYTQQDAADALGCSRQALRNWEDGTSKCPRYIGLAMAALAMGMSPYGTNGDDKDDNSNG
jgi:DNA-binding XRE family transcriptional regulator